MHVAGWRALLVLHLTFRTLADFQNQLVHQLVIPPQFALQRCSLDDELAGGLQTVIAPPGLLIFAYFKVLNRWAGGELANLVDFYGPANPLARPCVYGKEAAEQTNLPAHSDIYPADHRPEIRIDTQ